VLARSLKTYFPTAGDTPATNSQIGVNVVCLGKTFWLSKLARLFGERRAGWICYVL